MPVISFSVHTFTNCYSENAVNFSSQKCAGFLPVSSYMITIMMNNKVPVAGLETNETGFENVKDLKQLSADNVTSNGKFGVLGLRRIRKKARSFRIHNRIPRL
jgi:hypothetical protein